MAKTREVWAKVHLDKHGVYYAQCPRRKCRGRSPLGVYAIAQMVSDTLSGPCKKCGQPIKFGYDRDAENPNG